MEGRMESGVQRKKGQKNGGIGRVSLTVAYAKTALDKRRGKTKEGELPEKGQSA